MWHAFRSTCRIRGWYRPVVSSINVDRIRDRRGVVAGVRYATIVVTKVLLLLLIKMTTCRVSLDVIAAVHLCDFAAALRLRGPHVSISIFLVSDTLRLRLSRCAQASRETPIYLRLQYVTDRTL